MFLQQTFGPLSNRSQPVHPMCTMQSFIPVLIDLSVPVTCSSSLESESESSLSSESWKTALNRSTGAFSPSARDLGPVSFDVELSPLSSQADSDSASFSSSENKIFYMH